MISSLGNKSGKGGGVWPCWERGWVVLTKSKASSSPVWRLAWSFSHPSSITSFQRCWLSNQFKLPRLESHLIWLCYGRWGQRAQPPPSYLHLGSHCTNTRFPWTGGRRPAEAWSLIRTAQSLPHFQTLLLNASRAVSESGFSSRSPVTVFVSEPSCSGSRELCVHLYRCCSWASLWGVGWAFPISSERTSVSKTSSLRENLAKRQAVPLLSMCVCVCVFSDTFEYTLKWNKERMIKWCSMQRCSWSLWAVVLYRCIIISKWTENL